MSEGQGEVALSRADDDGRMNSFISPNVCLRYLLFDRNALYSFQKLLVDLLKYICV